jgi:hypothetical protein
MVGPFSLTTGEVEGWVRTDPPEFMNWAGLIGRPSDRPPRPVSICVTYLFMNLTVGPGCERIQAVLL